MPSFAEFFFLFYQSALKPVITVVVIFWWLWLFILSFFLVWNFWLYYRRVFYKKAIRWTLLEIRVPLELRKSPKAMEQILEQIHCLRNTPTSIQDKYVRGEVTLWFSLEIVSFGGDIHFYIRTPARYRNIIEAQIYSNYQDVEIGEVTDYIDRLPAKTKDFYKMGMDLFGMELVLRKEDVYPIRTYSEFQVMEEEKSLDPFSLLIEVLSKVKKEEHLWIQVLIKPTGSEWKKRGDKIVQELKEKSISRAKIGEGEEAVTISRSPGETAVIEAIEKNIAKSGFETIIRYIYFAPRTIFDHQLAMRGVRSAFAQYSTQNLNSFRLNINTLTIGVLWWGKFPFFFAKKRREARRQGILQNYRLRRMSEEMAIGTFLNSKFLYFDKKSKSFVLNTEEVATIFHLPSFLVLTGPFIKRVEAKHLGPPAGLEIFGEEEKEGFSGFDIQGKENAQEKKE